MEESRWFRKGWFKNALLVLLLAVLAVVAFRSLFPELGHGWRHHGYHHDEAHDEAHDGEYRHSHWEKYGKRGWGRLGAWKGMLACPKDERWIKTRLYMGRDIDGDKLGVSDSAWAAFLDKEIRTRLPDGFSVADVYGYSATDNPNHEKWTKVLILLHDGSEEKRAALAEIAEAYLAQNSQHSVLRSETVACVKFLGGDG